MVFPSSCLLASWQECRRRSVCWASISLLQMQDPTNYGQYYFLVPLFVVLFLAVIWVIAFERFRTPYPGSVCKAVWLAARCTVARSTHSDQGCNVRRFADHLCKLDSLDSEYDSALYGWECNRLLANLSLTPFLPRVGFYSVLYFLLIIMFAYFYVTIQYNPIEMANNLRQNNGTIPGIRPAKPTSDFISKDSFQDHLIGALFLAVIALLPILFGLLPVCTTCLWAVLPSSSWLVLRWIPWSRWNPR